MQSRMSKNLIFSNIGGFDGEFYPAESLLALFRYSNLTKNKTGLKLVSNFGSQLNQKLSKSNFYLIWPKRNKSDSETFGENSQGRLVLALAQLYRESNISIFKSTLHEAFLALTKLPLISTQSTITHKMYRLPAYAFKNTKDPEAISGRTLDPNHDATLAAAYFYAAQTTALSSLEKVSALKLADYYFRASLDLASSKCLPLADQKIWRSACDTRYNSFWIYWTNKLQRSLGDEGSEGKIRAQYEVLSQFSKRFQTQGVYPVEYKGPYLNPAEAFSLFGVTAKYGSYEEFKTWQKNLNAWILANGNGSESWPIGMLFP